MKKLLIVGSVITIVGLLIALVAFAVLGFDANKLSTRKITTDTYEITEEFDNIEIDTVSENITFIPCEEGESRVVYVHNAELKAKIEVRGRSLVISEKGITNWTDFIGTSDETTKLEIYIPAGEYSKLDVDSGSADITVGEEFNFEVIEIDTASGDIDIVGATPSDISIDTASGDIVLTDVVAGVIEIDTASGDITLNACDASSISIDTASGDITGTLLTGKIFSIDTAVGRVDVPEDSAGGHFNADTASGDVTISIA